MTGAHRDHQFVAGNRDSIEVGFVGVHQRGDDEVEFPFTQRLAQHSAEAGGDLESQIGRAHV